MATAKWKLATAGLGLVLAGVAIGTVIVWRLAERGLVFKSATTIQPSPVIELTNKGRYDAAVKAALAIIRRPEDEPFGDQQVAMVYLIRAYKDPPHREQWVQTAGSYIDKTVALAPTDFGMLSESAREYEQAGDLSKDGCPYYRKAVLAAEKVEPMVESDSLMVRDMKFPTKELRQGNQAFLKRLNTKLDSWCTSK